MIWAFEWLNEAQKGEMVYLNPFTDFRFSFKERMFKWTTFCAGFDVDHKEIRRLRLFELNNAKQGFVCDDWEEARLLACFLEQPLEFDFIVKDFPWLPAYIKWFQECNPYGDIECIALSLSAYIAHYQDDAERLGFIDSNSLTGMNNWNRG